MMKFIEKIKEALYLTPLYDWFGKRSFAQSGEDLIAWQLSGAARSAPTVGFYVDVGAYHPKLFSNTYLFYKKGWRGICVEPNSEMASLYRVARPRDMFLNVGVGAGEGVTVSQCHKSLSASPFLPLTRETEKMEYFMFEDGAANTFSAEQARKNIVEAGRKLKGKTNIKIKTLKSILDKNLPKGQRIDLLSVDVEGMDEEVLRSNDWKKYRPTIIIAEDLGFELGEFVGQARGPAPTKRGKIPLDPPLTRGKWEVGVVGFLNSVGYRLVAKTPYSLIFKRVEGDCRLETGAARIAPTMR